jgi:GNAT superfamily N-acetyltransferase
MLAGSVGGSATDAAGGAPTVLPEDAALGARAALLRAADPPDVVLLEPLREGRLAASLARFGEGPCAVYVALEGADRLSSALEPASDGPMGRERLLAGGPAWGPHVVVVLDAVAAPAARARVATIRAMSDTSPRLRPAIEGDAPRIAALLTEEGYPTGPSDVADRLGRFAHPSAVVVAATDGDLLGFIAVHVMPRFEHGDSIARVLALVVDAGARERGVGGLLLGEAERIGRAAGAAFLEVTAGHHRPEARRLYESAGFDASVTSYLRKRL